MVAVVTVLLKAALISECAVVDSSFTDPCSIWTKYTGAQSRPSTFR